VRHDWPGNVRELENAVAQDGEVSSNEATVKIEITNQKR